MWTVGRGCYVVASDGRAEIQGSKVPKLHGMEWPTNDALSATNKIRSVSRSKGQLESSIRQKAHRAANVRGECEKGKYPLCPAPHAHTHDHRNQPTDRQLHEAAPASSNLIVHHVMHAPSFGFFPLCRETILHWMYTPALSPFP